MALDVSPVRPKVVFGVTVLEVSDTVVSFGSAGRRTTRSDSDTPPAAQPGMRFGRNACFGSVSVALIARTSLIPVVAGPRTKVVPLLTSGKDLEGDM